jgi:hypothetical protein
MNKPICEIAFSEQFVTETLSKLSVKGGVIYEG